MHPHSLLAENPLSSSGVGLNVPICTFHRNPYGLPIAPIIILLSLYSISTILQDYPIEEEGRGAAVQSIY